MAESSCLSLFCSNIFWVCGATSMRRLHDQHLHKMEAGDTTPCSPNPPLSLEQAKV